MTATPPVAPVTSRVLREPAAAPEEARAHFARRLGVETDPSDVWADMQAGVDGFAVVDVRTSDAYAQGHVPGAVSLPHRDIDERTTAHLSRDGVVVAYCWGPHCNGADRGALRLAELGFRVKTMIGGYWGWLQDGQPVDTGS